MSNQMAQLQQFEITINQWSKGKCSGWSFHTVSAENLAHAREIADAIAIKFNEVAQNCAYSVAMVRVIG